MPHINQRGFSQFLVMGLLVIGLVAGLFLVSHPTVFKPKAFDGIADPAISVTPTPASDGWVFCAREFSANAVCSFIGTKQVRYGANGVYNYKVVAGRIECGNNPFGDPVPGVLKHCDYLSTGGTLPPNPSVTPMPRLTY